MSPAGSAFQQPMHTHRNTMLHAKASMGKGEYQLSIKYMLSFPDAVRLQVINLTFERFPITNACASLITSSQHISGEKASLKTPAAISVQTEPKE